MAKSLPTKPNLENLKKQAKSLLKSHSSGDLAACSTLRNLRRFARSTDQEILGAGVSLAEVHYAIAMEYGFSSWDALKTSIEGGNGEKRFLHLHVGDRAAEAMRRSGVPGTVVIWHDVFLEGPNPSGVSEEEWIRLRARTYFDYLGTDDADAALADMQHRLDNFREFEEVVLWFDPCLFDQTALIRHLDWFSKQDMGITKLSLVLVGEFPGIPNFRGLGDLRPEQMASLIDTRGPVTQADFDLAVKAWQAYRSPNPTEIEKLLAGDTSALPYIAPALRRHLQRFPSVRNGLDRLEQESLEMISRGIGEFPDLFAQLREMENPLAFYESMLLKQLVQLTSGNDPLLRIHGADQDQPLQKWSTDDISFTITDTGRKVLAGELDQVRLNGIDRWLGGVHLEGHEAAWRWDEDEGKLTVEI